MTTLVNHFTIIKAVGDADFHTILFERKELLADPIEVRDAEVTAQGGETCQDMTGDVVDVSLTSVRDNTVTFFHKSLPVGEYDIFVTGHLNPTGTRTVHGKIIVKDFKLSCTLPES
jgi:hypothetical protein